VIERFYEGKTIRVELEALGEVDAPGSDVLRSTERSVLKLLTT
jgi:hypothetical protein